jgi:transcriptional accessory protein Tex/SPT6
VASLTLQDIMKELEKPGLDPRGSAKAFEFGNVHSMEDLHEGMILPGIVTNITNFGAFVDIGVKESGLVHVSQMADKFIKNPMDVVSLGQQVTVRVVEVDLARKRVASVCGSDHLHLLLFSEVGCSGRDDRINIGQTGGDNRQVFLQPVNNHGYLPH